MTDKLNGRNGRTDQEIIDQGHNIYLTASHAETIGIADNTYEHGTYDHYFYEGGIEKAKEAQQELIEAIS